MRKGPREREQTARRPVRMQSPKLYHHEEKAGKSSGDARPRTSVPYLGRKRWHRITEPIDDYGVPGIRVIMQIRASVAVRNERTPPKIKEMRSPVALY